MFVFVDESGNTGQNLFDENQPVFTTLALITRTDFDKLQGIGISQLADRLAVEELHASELGVDGIEEIAGEILDIIKAAKARFAISRLEKKYLLASKIFDSIFDSGENLGAAWHVYNLKPLRMMMLFKFSAEIPENLARDFWAAMMAKNANAAETGLVKFCQDMLAIMPSMGDKGAAERISQALTWARDNPEAIYLHSSGKLARHGHLPNTVGFGNLLDGIEAHSKRLGKPIKLIRHDEQSEFEAAIRFWHDFFSNASPDAVELMLGEKFVMQKGYGSKLAMARSKDSPGIQVVDILLWLFNRLSGRRDIGQKSWKLMQYVFRHGFQVDFSFEAVEQAVLKQYGDIFFTEPPPEKLAEAREELARLENLYKARIDEYAQSKRQVSSADTVKPAPPERSQGTER